MECAWKSIPFKDIEMGKQIGGGGVGVIYAGTYQNESVALKTLVSITRVLQNDIYIILV